MVLSLLPFVCLTLYVIEYGDLLFQVTFYIGALGFGDIFHCVLLALELTDLFSLQGHLLSQLHDLLFESIDGGLEAEGLLRAHSCIRLTSNRGTDAGKPASLYLSRSSKVLTAHISY